MFFGFEYSFKSDEKKINGSELIDKIYNLFKELNVNSELSLCNLYLYLLYTGRLSINKTFVYNSNDIKDNDFYNLMLGYGCCRNIASGLKQVLDKADVKNCILSTAPLLRKPNHVVNLIITDKGYFIYDITNMLFLKVTGNFLKSLNEKMMPIRVSDIDTTFYGERKSAIDMYNNTYDKKFDASILLKKVRKNPEYTKEEYLKTYEKDIAYFKENEDVINIFYDDAYYNIEKISELLLK